MMMEFLVASAIGLIFALRWSAFLWPAGAMLIAAASVAAASWSPGLALLATLAIAIAGYNAGLLAGLLLGAFRREAARPARGVASGDVSPGS